MQIVCHIIYFVFDVKTLKEKKQYRNSLRKPFILGRFFMGKT